MTDSRLPRAAFARLGFIAVVLAGIGSYPAVSRADPAPAPPRAPAAKCEMPYDEAVSYGRRGVAADNAAVFTDYSGEEASKLLIGINAFPPVSDWTADHILVFDAPDEAIVVGLVEKGCLTKALEVPREDWAGVRRAALGDPS
jgi:hypothetical protein